MTGDHAVTTELVEAVTTTGRTAAEQGFRSAPPGIRTQNLRIKSPLLCR